MRLAATQRAIGIWARDGKVDGLTDAKITDIPIPTPGKWWLMVKLPTLAIYQWEPWGRWDPTQFVYSHIIVWDT